jgi:hypothetical protein
MFIYLDEYLMDHPVSALYQKFAAEGEAAPQGVQHLYPKCWFVWCAFLHDAGVGLRPSISGRYFGAILHDEKLERRVA